MVLTVPDNWLSAGRIKQEFVNNLVVSRIFVYPKASSYLTLYNSLRIRKTLPRIASSYVLLTHEVDKDNIGQLHVFIHRN